jgi:hypothetical protein
MRLALSIIILSLIVSCAARKKKREWESKKYPDSHFYTVLQQPFQLDTSLLKTNRTYIRTYCDTCFRFLHFANDQKVYTTHWNNVSIDPGKFPGEKFLYGYYRTKHDTLIIEQIGIFRLRLTKKGKGLFPSLYHVKTVGILKKDSILLSNESVGIHDFERLHQPVVFKLKQ